MFSNMVLPVTVLSAFIITGLRGVLLVLFSSIGLASGLDPSVMLLIWASFVIMFLGIVDLSNLSGRWVLRFSLNSVVTVPR